MTLPPPPEWWWFPYVPKSRLVLLDGSEGIGKGLFCVWLAKQLTSGTFPDTDDRGRVLWLSAEDDPEEDILRRLYAAGYDSKDAEGIGFITQMLKVPSDVAALEALIYEHKASVLIMDPGRSFLSPPEGTKDFSFNNEAHVRPGMEELNRLAKRTSCTILFVHHWNKNTTADIQYRSGGSGAFAQVVRHRVTLAWHGSTEEGEGAFEVQKSNIASRGHVHGYRVDASPAWDTATFALAGDMPEFQSLGEWFKACATDQVSMDWSDNLATILENGVVRGARIPSEAELMNELGISRRELRAATVTLIDDGILVKDHGQRRPVYKGLNP
jgi:KaiC/GvpD/RAD55 family RecA-like ATPase